MTLLKKKVKFLSKSNQGERHLQWKNPQVLYIMNLDSLVAFENFEWLLMTPAVICNNCNFTKQYWSNILSNEFLGGDIWMLQVILSLAKCQWNVCYNKLKQGNFQKTDVGGETQDIFKNLQSLVVILNHFFLRYLGDSYEHGNNGTVYARELIECIKYFKEDWIYESTN